MTILKKHIIGLLILIGVFGFLALYTFTTKLDLNGDNCFYYIHAKALATGKGYVNLSAPGNPASNMFPPGYPIIMAPLLWFTDSVAAQNFLGELFLLGTVMVLYFFVYRLKNEKIFSIFLCLMILVNLFLLQFATMMMSELPYAFLVAVCIYNLYAFEEKHPFYKNKYFIIIILSAVLGYHVRTQGIVLLLAILIHFAFNRQWKTLLQTIAGFSIGLAPWILRNKLLHLGGNRYLSQILAVDQLAPEKGNISFLDFAGRTFTQLWDLIGNQLPQSLFNFFIVDHFNKVNYPVLGIVFFVFILAGCWYIQKIRFFLLSFVLGNLAIISIWNGKGVENRYLICILPVLIVCFYYGLFKTIEWVLKKTVNPIIIGFASLIMFVIQYRGLTPLHEMNIDEYPANYQSFITMSEWINTNLPENAVIAVRKPEIFYMFAKRKCVSYLFSNESKKIMDDLVDNKVDYVFLDQLGYTTTSTFLAPALEKYRGHFAIQHFIGEPRTYLLRFDKRKPEN